jgi:AAA15 family ATPase/GTPase
MKYIDKIEIKYFRSLKNASVKNTNHLNILSGKNDIGKSNVLRALDLFFGTYKCNFQEDYNKERLSDVKDESIKGKQIINIAITFNKPKSAISLPSKFRVSRTWDRNGNLISQNDNLENALKKSKISNVSIKTSRSSLTAFMNKIYYIHVPVVRGEVFFSELLGILQNEMFAAEGRKTKHDKSKMISKVTRTLNKEINSLTQYLNKDFMASTGIDSNITLPTSMAELFRALQIDTQHGGHEISLTNRGQGLKMRYIPTILNYISSISRSYFIWGFDEPENSCEYSLCNKMAEDFENIYSNNAQIFIVSHSFSFVTLQSSMTSVYRVYMDDNDINSQIEPHPYDSNKLENELGIYQIHHKLNKTFEEYNESLDYYKEVEDKLKDNTKPQLFFEGESDSINFSTAHQNIFNSDIIESYKLGKHLKSKEGSSIGDGAPLLNNFMYQYVGKMPSGSIVIGVFDYDEEGMKQIKSLVNKGDYVQYQNDVGYKHVYKKEDSDNIYVMLIVPPDHRIDFYDSENPDFCRVSTELLFMDKEIPANNRKYPSKFDDRTFSFSGKKVSFANSIKTKVSKGKEIDFSGFSPTFELLRKIIS